MRLSQSPGTSAIATIENYLESVLHFKWNYRSNTHSPLVAANAYASPEGATDLIEYSSNPKGAIFFEKRYRQQEGHSESLPGYGEAILMFRVFCSAADASAMANELRDIEWALEDKLLPSRRGEFGLPPLFYRSTEFNERANVVEGPSGALGYTTGMFVARFLMRAF